MNKKTIKKIIYPILGIIILAALALPKISFTDDNKQIRPEFKKSVQVKAKIVFPEKMDKDISATANLLGNEAVMLQSEISGKVIKLNIDEGNFVKKGELLLKINDADLQARKSQTESRIKLLEDKEYRLKKLLEKDGISTEEYDIALNELNVEKSEADYLQALIDKTELKAPFDGVIGLKNISEGAYVTPQTEIAEFQQINIIKLEFNLPQKHYNSIKEGDEIEFSLPYLSKIRKAKIYAIEPRINQQTRTIKVRALTNNSDRKLLPGAYAEVKINTEENDDAYLIPTEALIPELGGEKVYIVKNGKAVPKKVGVGMRTADNVQITSGIAEGDTLIISGIIQLRPGIDVSVTSISNNQ